jgi:curli production assembly/transport component CsgG
MKKFIILATLTSFLGGCAIVQTTGLNEQDPTVSELRKNIQKEFDTIPPPASGKPISVAVYSFSDKTGQRRPQANVASLSTAVTQGAETFLIQALQNVGKSRWFDVVERVGIDNLTKERTIIRQMREAYEGPNAKPLMPMQFAGMILEGGIIGYDSSINSGGAGMRVFGIGKQTQWSQDVVTVSLRAVSVNTGKVLISVTVQKTILSSADSATALKFYDMGTKSFEAELGLTINEPGTYAVKSAVEMAVVELIKEGQRKAVWDYRETPVVAPVAAPVTPTANPVISSEIKKSDTEVVQEPAPEAVPNLKEDHKVEAKAAEAKVIGANLKPVATPQGLKVTPLFGQRKLKEDSYLYAEANTTSTKKWQFKKGTEVKVVQPGSEGWLRVVDSESRGGWIRTEVLEQLK